MSVNFLIAVGGSGVKIATAFIEYCMAYPKDLGTVMIYIHDADSENGDCDRLRQVAKHYENIHAMGKGEIAATQIVLMTENLADFMKDHKLDAMISNTDPRKKVMNGSTDWKDRDMSLKAGQYGRSDIGAFNNISRRAAYRKSEIIKFVLRYLGDGKDVNVMAVGSCTGGTGSSYTLDDVWQVKKAALESNAADHLRTAIGLLGPCFTNPSPSQKEMEEYGAKYHVDSNEAFARTAATLYHLNTIENLFPNLENGKEYYLDKLYLAGNSKLDPGAKVWRPHGQEEHEVHLLHFSHAMCIQDFFEHSIDTNEENDNRLHTVRYSKSGEELKIFNWENLPSLFKTSFVSTMRFCLMFCTEMVPLFHSEPREFQNNYTAQRWFGISGRRTISPNLLTELTKCVDEINQGCQDFIRCFFEIQDCTELGTGTKLVKLFNQDVLNTLLREDYRQVPITRIIENAYCQPDRLTEESWNSLSTNLDGTRIMIALAQNSELCKKIKGMSQTPDYSQAAESIISEVIKAIRDMGDVKNE